MRKSMNSNDPVHAMRSAACDCGRPRDRACATCSACAWLDGASGSEALVIAALRGLGSAGTWDALVLEVDIPDRTLWRALAKLRRVGRVIVKDDGVRATYALRTR